MENWFTTGHWTQSAGSIYEYFRQRILTYFVKGSIAVRPTSCLICLDSVALLKSNKLQIYLFRQIENSQPGCQQWYVPLQSNWLFYDLGICYSPSYLGSRKITENSDILNILSDRRTFLKTWVMDFFPNTLNTFAKNILNILTNNCVPI